MNNHIRKGSSRTFWKKTKNINPLKTFHLPSSAMISLLVLIGVGKMIVRKPPGNSCLHLPMCKIVLFIIIFYLLGPSLSAILSSTLNFVMGGFASWIRGSDPAHARSFVMGGFASRIRGSDPAHARSLFHIIIL